MLSGALKKSIASSLCRRAVVQQYYSRTADIVGRSLAHAVSTRLLDASNSLILPKSAFSTAAAAKAESVAPPATALNENQGVVEKPFVSTPERKYKYFQNVEITPNGVAIIRFDNPEKKVNTLSFAVMKEAQSLWNDDVHSNGDVKSIVFTSAKESGFIAGADIFDISSVVDKSTLVPLIESALNFFRRMKSKGVPMVAAIHGPALGKFAP